MKQKIIKLLNTKVYTLSTKEYAIILLVGLCIFLWFQCLYMKQKLLINKSVVESNLYQTVQETLRFNNLMMDRYGK